MCPSRDSNKDIAFFYVVHYTVTLVLLLKGIHIEVFFPVVQRIKPSFNPHFAIKVAGFDRIRPPFQQTKEAYRQI